VKNEIIYCVGNCILSIQDTLLINGLHLLRQVIDQGAIKVLTQALDFTAANTQNLGLKVALDGLLGFFKVFKKAQKPRASDELKQ